MEIFFHLTKNTPKPVFDTQIAAMVCGYGDAISYDKLVKQLLGIEIDKSSRFRLVPATIIKHSIKICLSDVTHLRKVYEKLKKQLRENGRETWLVENWILLPVQQPI